MKRKIRFARESSIKKSGKKQKLVDEVIEQMKRDISDNDWTAIDGLLYNCDSALLEGFLQEN